MRPLVWICLVSSAMLAGCSDDTSRPQDHQGFLLSIKVMDGTGSPVPALRVSACNQFPCEYTTDGCFDLPMARLAERSAFDAPRIYQNAPNPFSGYTQMRFYLPDSSWIRLQVLDLEGRPRRTLYDGPARAGAHSVLWDGQPRYSTSIVHEVHFQVYSPDGSTVVYQDTLFSAYYDRDTDNPDGILGYTDRNGRVVSEARIRFPSLYSYPPMPVTDEQGVEKGIAAFTDTLLIAVADTSQGTTHVYKRVLANGSNTFVLTWE